MNRVYCCESFRIAHESEIFNPTSDINPNHPGWWIWNEEENEKMYLKYCPFCGVNIK